MRDTAKAVARPVRDGTMRDAARVVRCRESADGGHTRRRLASYRGHGWMPLLRRRSNVFEVPCRRCDHVDGELARQPDQWRAGGWVLADFQRLACG